MDEWLEKIKTRIKLAGYLPEFFEDIKREKVAKRDSKLV
jgi:hypothetical protein